MRIVWMSGRHGHKVVECETADQTIEQLQKMMNEEPSSSILAEDPPGSPAKRLGSPEEVKKLSPDAKVYLAPQMVGG